MMRDGKVVPTVFDCITYLPDIKAYFQNMETKYPDDRQFRMYKKIIEESLNILKKQPTSTGKVPDIEEIVESFNKERVEVWNDDDAFDMGYNNGLEEGKNIALRLFGYDVK